MEETQLFQDSEPVQTLLLSSKKVVCSRGRPGWLSYFSVARMLSPSLEASGLPGPGELAFGLSQQSSSGRRCSRAREVERAQPLEQVVGTFGWSLAWDGMSRENANCAGSDSLLADFREELTGHLIKLPPHGRRAGSTGQESRVLSFLHCGRKCRRKHIGD